MEISMCGWQEEGKLVLMGHINNNHKITGEQKQIKCANTQTKEQFWFNVL